MTGPVAFHTVATSWEHFAHEADLGLRAIAPDKASLFESMALAMTAAITDPELITPRETVNIECAAPDDEVLLVDWLNALIYEMATRRMVFGEFEVALDDGRLQGIARGEAVDRTKHHPTVEIKGATYTALKLTHNDTGDWSAQCVVDV